MPDVGVAAIYTCGGWLGGGGGAETVITTDALAEAPALSVTVRRAVKLPAD
jgi:hypothetical protein